MSTYEKLVRQIRNNPSDVRWEDLLRVLEREGFSLITVRGSHHNFTHPTLGERTITIVKRQPPKAVYVRAVLDAIDEVKEE